MYNAVNTLVPSFLIGSSSFLQVTRTTVKSWSSSKLVQIQPCTEVLAALDGLKKIFYLLEKYSKYFDAMLAPLGNLFPSTCEKKNPETEQQNSITYQRRLCITIECHYRNKPLMQIQCLCSGFSQWYHWKFYQCFHW